MNTMMNFAFPRKSRYSICISLWRDFLDFFFLLRFLCKFSIISELSFMQWSLYCTISHYATLHFFQLLKKHRFCIHFFSWGLSDPKWPRNNKNNRFLKKKFHDPRETQKFCFLATCHIRGNLPVRKPEPPSVRGTLVIYLRRRRRFSCVDKPDLVRRRARR